MIVVFLELVLLNHHLLIEVVVAVHLERELEPVDPLAIVAHSQRLRHRKLLLSVTHQGELGQISLLEEVFAKRRSRDIGAGLGQLVDAD